MSSSEAQSRSERPLFQVTKKFKQLPIFWVLDSLWCTLAQVDLDNTLRVRVPNHHILSQNMYRNSSTKTSSAHTLNPKPSQIGTILQTNQ